MSVLLCAAFVLEGELWLSSDWKDVGCARLASECCAVGLACISDGDLTN